MDLKEGSLKGDNEGGQNRISTEHGDRISCERAGTSGSATRQAVILSCCY